MKTSARLVLLTCLLLAASVIAQDLPEYGKVEDLKGLTKVYVSAPSTKQREKISKELRKNAALSIAESPEAADFFVEYKVISDQPVGPMNEMHFTTIEMAVYTMKGDKRRIAWSKTANPAWHPAEESLPRDFLKALKNATKN